MNVEIGASGMLARVTAVDDGGRSVFFDFRNGNTGSFNHDGQEEYTTGDVLLITGDINGGITAITKVPLTAWPDALWVGIVKVKLPDITVVDSGARFRTVPTVTTVKYEVGNTVQTGDVQGVIRVLSEKPIKYIDLPEVDDSVIDGFRAGPPNESSPRFGDFGGLQGVVTRALELIEIPLSPNPPKDTDGRREESGRGVRELQGK